MDKLSQRARPLGAAVRGRHDGDRANHGDGFFRQPRVRRRDVQQSAARVDGRPNKAVVGRSRTVVVKNILLLLVHDAEPACKRDGLTVIRHRPLSGGHSVPLLPFLRLLCRFFD